VGFGCRSSHPYLLSWVGSGQSSGPVTQGCRVCCHSFALRGSRRLAARHPATTRLLIENCELIAA